MSANVKKICFRFDVDTHKCAKVGVPRLLDLAKRKNVPFTFFVNCGRSISHYHSLKAMFASRGPVADSPKLSARRKLGTLEYLRCALLNPQVSRYAAEEIKRAHKEGHEIGLHGGRNHELWGRFVDHWSEEKVRNEIEWGLQELNILGITPTSFASPCAAGGERVRKIISQYDVFDFISDDLNPEHVKPHATGGLLDVPTALCGSGGVAYIEHFVAQNLSENEIVEKFRAQIEKLKVAVFYDHPYFAGDEAFPIMEKFVDCALKDGFEVTTLSDIGRYYEKENYLPRERA